MFLESLIESSKQAKGRRGLATLISFLLESSAIGVLILVPLLFTDALPAVMRATETVLSVPPAEAPPSPPVSQTHAAPTMTNTEFQDGRLQAPRIVPPDIYVPSAPEAPPAIAGIPVGPGIPGGTGTGPMSPIMRELIGPVTHVAPPPPPNTPVVISHVEESLLIRRVQPDYPRLAIAAHIQGSVSLRAIIARDGTIRDAQVLNGHPMLVNAALDAVRQWRYRPFYLNGHPVEVETQVTVNFTLNR